MGKIIDGKKIAAKIENELIEQIQKLKEQNIVPKLCVIYVGNDAPSKTYIRRKQEAAERIGIDFKLFTFPSDILKTKLIGQIVSIQKIEKPSGLIVQLPLPGHLYTPEVLNAIDPKIDVDCLTDVNQGKLLMQTNFLEPPTPAAVMAILKETKVNPKGKVVTILGTGQLVGKPLSTMLTNAEATVIACNSKTKNIKQKCLEADIIVTAVGKCKLLTADMVKKGTIVIDTGIVFKEHKMYGDVDFESVKKKAKFITPTPGGVGPITVAILLYNTLICAKKIWKIPKLNS